MKPETSIIPTIINPSRLILGYPRKIVIERKKKIDEAFDRISKYIRTTPLEKSSFFQKKFNQNVFLKMENLQYTGSFKLRGALNKILSLSENNSEIDIITASTGNHGAATAFALQQVKKTGTILLPKSVNKAKLAKLEQYKVKLDFYGEDSSETEIEARKRAEQNDNLLYISPYNDDLIVAGQGTIGIELSRQIDRIDNIFITVGGGGLISGVATYLKSINPEIKIYGCQPINSPVMYESVKAGKIIKINSLDTLSDGSAGGVDEDTVTFPIIQQLVDEFVLIEESEIEQALFELYFYDKLIVEGAAAVAFAACKKKINDVKGNSIVLLCGGNIDMDLFSSIITRIYSQT